MFLAFILLYQCESCSKIAAIKTEKDQLNFKSEWHDGSLFQFCPDCKTRTENQEKILRDKNYDFYLNNLEVFSDVELKSIN